MNVWIQKHDFESDSFEFELADEVNLLYDEYDWNSEIEKQKNCENESCDPGMGLVVGDGHTLHVCPNEEGMALVFFDYPERSKFLGIFSSTKQKCLRRGAVSRDKVHQLVHLLFQGQYEQIKSEL